MPKEKNLRVRSNVDSCASEYLFCHATRYKKWGLLREMTDGTDPSPSSSYIENTYVRPEHYSMSGNSTPRQGAKRSGDVSPREAISQTVARMDEQHNSPGAACVLVIGITSHDLSVLSGPSIDARYSKGGNGRHEARIE